jgi:hypothetical protein
MTKKTFLAIIDGKIIGKRTSEGRTYTHVIVGQLDIEAHRKAAYGYKQGRSDASNFAFYRSFLDGTSRYLDRNSWESEEEHAQRVGREVERAREILAGAETVEAYVAVLRQRAIAAFEKRVQNGYFDMQAIQWSMSERAARNAIGSWSRGRLNVQIIEATEKGR